MKKLLWWKKEKSEKEKVLEAIERIAQRVKVRMQFLQPGVNAKKEKDNEK